MRDTLRPAAIGPGAPPVALPAAVRADLNDTRANFVSDGAVPAQIVDPDLKNPWGISHSATSPFWVSDQAPGTSGTSTLYDVNPNTGSVTKAAITVDFPTSGTGPQGPTGQVNNGVCVDSSGGSLPR